MAELRRFNRTIWSLYQARVAASLLFAAVDDRRRTPTGTAGVAPGPASTAGAAKTPGPTSAAGGAGFDQRPLAVLTGIQGAAGPVVARAATLRGAPGVRNDAALDRANEIRTVQPLHRKRSQREHRRESGASNASPQPANRLRQACPPAPLLVSSRPRVDAHERGVSTAPT